MSGVAKAVGKVFKSVVNVVKKVLPIALAAGAIYFTAGAALGVAGTAGGWGSAVSGMVSKMGGTGVLGKVLTGAVTQAGYGAAMGAGMSLITGGDPMQGLTRGALTGAISGGVMGGLGLNADPLSGVGQSNQATQPAMGAATQASGPPTSLLPGSAGQPVLPSQVPQAVGTAAQNIGPQAQTVAASAGAAAPQQAAPGFFDQGGWLERNQMLAGHAVQGLGGGLLSMAEADDRQAAARVGLERDQAQADRIAANYGSGQVPGYRQLASVPGQPPAQRFDPRLLDGQYVYNPQTGRVEWVPNGSAVA